MLIPHIERNLEDRIGDNTKFINEKANFSGESCELKHPILNFNEFGSNSTQNRLENETHIFFIDFQFGTSERDMLGE